MTTESASVVDAVDPAVANGALPDHARNRLILKGFSDAR